MCVVIDANTISKVFDSTNAQHGRFKPVALWVAYGKGRVIYGGTKYLKELSNGKYLGLFVELFNARRAIRVDTKAVDKRAALLKSKVKDSNFDDEHIIAIVGLSGCCLVCTDDNRAIPYIKRKDLYPDGVMAPRIYNRPADMKRCLSTCNVCRHTGAAVPRWQKKAKKRPHVKILKG